MMERPTEVDNGAASSSREDPSITGLHEKHRRERENLTFMKQPIKTVQLFTLATIDDLKRLIFYILQNGGWITLSFLVIVVICILLIILDGPHEKHVDEALEYMRFGLWWVALGMASSIGLGSGLHTFVLYLGPHIALFTIKAIQCGRVDLKTAAYDTIQLKRAPSWLDKDCSEFGPPMFLPTTASMVKVPLSKLLPQVQLEAVLWGFGTALGELPPYFISRAARLSGTRFESIEELDNENSNEDGLFSSSLKRMKHWLLSKSQHLNFFTILILASVPNPLFDLAGIMCGQFGVPFWKFFIAILIGKALIKAHIQTIFLITLCNNSLLEFVETRVVWAIAHIPGFSTALPSIIAKLQSAKEKFLSSSLTSATSQVKGQKWNISFTLIWNTVIWLVVVHFFVTIVTSTAQRYLKKQQDLEMADRLLAPNHASAANLNGASDRS